MDIGEKIKTLRKAKKLTQEQLAEYLNISAQAVSKWETGASAPDIDTLPKLAVFFGTTVDDLLDFDRRRSRSPCRCAPTPRRRRRSTARR